MDKLTKCYIMTMHNESIQESIHLMTLFNIYFNPLRWLPIILHHATVELSVTRVYPDYESLISVLVC